MKTILLVIVMLSASCSEDNKKGPVDIQYGQDICERCKMIISEERFSSQLISEKGDVYNFDDIGGMLLYLAEKNISPENSKIYVKDFNTGKWLAGDDAVFIITEDIRTPMNYGIIAFSDRKSAVETVSSHGGRLVGGFSDALDFLNNNKLNH